MIRVYLSGNNSFQLQGNELNEDYSRVTLHRDGWEINLNIRGFPLAVRSGLKREEVVSAIQEEMRNMHRSDEINAGEIRFYMQQVERDFGPGGKYSL